MRPASGRKRKEKETEKRESVEMAVADRGCDDIAIAACLLGFRPTDARQRE